MITTKDVRTLKGAPLAILILAILDQQPHSAKWYERMSGYTDKPITQGLALLTELDFLLRTPKGWMIATDQQLKLSTVYPQLEEQNRNNSDSSALVVSSYIDSNINTLDLTTTTSDRNYSDLRELCLELGIQEPAASQIASMGLSKEFITAHVESGIDLPLAIYRIKKKFRAPEKKNSDPSRYEQGDYADYLD